jgi:glycosyltransferase involved in cell wall biosynthesis
VGERLERSIDVRYPPLVSSEGPERDPVHPVRATGRTAGAGVLAAPAGPELSVVIPVFNEARTIADVVLGWASVLDGLELDYELLVYDDGSTDDTRRILGDLGSRIPRLTVRTHSNRGHGATVLRGYREALGEWVFQTDSDGEVPAGSFPDLWRERHAHDLVLGIRQHRQAAWDRRLVSWLSRLSLRVLFGARVGDANVPFRLVRRAQLRALMAELPGDLFAPNVALAGIAARARLRIGEVPVPYVGRSEGRSSLAGWRIWRAAATAFRQTLAVALRARRPPCA